ncbi:MAG: DNA polymerase III subunit delta [Candidatus Saccharimonadales bacterium]
MITFLIGENNFESFRATKKIVAGFDGIPENFNGSDLELSQLSDSLLGRTLFSDKRLVIIKDLSDNKQLWDVLPEWLDKISDDIHVVFVESKPDKRTKTYKDLKKLANVIEFNLWGERDTFAAESWVADEAKKQDLILDKKSAQVLVERIGLEQWQLFHAIEKLTVLDEVNPRVIEEIIEVNPSENVFNLLDAALRADNEKVSNMIRLLQHIQDPYMTFGLLSSQVFQLAALTTTDKSASEVASAIGAHPYALGKLAPHARNLGKSSIKRIIETFADTDIAMKSSATDPWLLIEKTLVQIGTY